ncbi:MAG TPA: LPS export ABC transporter periplasmic protein LptC [Terriglobales bacterium]|nr:LPS export ABC transporter periplasmic protein LptC [Terriglobales bacterium]
MPLNVRRLRWWMASTAALLVLVLAGFYFYARMRAQRALAELPQKLGVEIQQSTKEFTLSKSEGGRTLFTIRAAKTLQYKEGGRAELHDVSIVLYGRESNRYDQIYGAVFQYDPQTGAVSAPGEVQIDLQADTEGAAHPDQAPPRELKNPIHLKTSGLTFNQKTGIATTDQTIEFNTPQANGAAVGAVYDTKAGTLTLRSRVAASISGNNPAVFTAEHGVISKEPAQAVFETVRGEQGDSTLQAGTVRALFRRDNTVEHVFASGGVVLARAGPGGGRFQSNNAELLMAGEDRVRQAIFTGNAVLDAAGDRPMHAEAGRVVADFVGQNRVAHVKATEHVRIAQLPPKAAPRGRAQTAADSQSFDLAADAVDADVKDGRILERAITSGAAQITLVQAPAPAEAQPTTSVVTAGRFETVFDGSNHLKSMHGSPGAKLVSRTAGQPDQVTTSRELDVTFAPGGRGVAAIVQQGDFHYQQAGREARAESARYTAADDLLVLNGSPRYSESGLALTANSMRVLRRTGEVSAEGDVKTTYTESKQSPGGAMLASGSPVHVTAAAMSARRAAGGASAVARYTGGARLWQDANIVEAPTIEFDRDRRSMLAEGSTLKPVSTVFTQIDSKGRAAPVNVSAARLTYSDSDRRARFSGGVVARGAETTLTADHADVILHPRNPPAGQSGGSGQAQGPSQVQQIVAEGRVTIEEPGRKATGTRLVYSAAEGKFVLTGGPPSIFDAEHGTITGDSLTFFQRDDRVVVESNGTSRTVTQTRVSK